RAPFGGHRLKNSLFTIDLGFNYGLRLFGRGGVAELEQAPETAGDRAPPLALMAADAAPGANPDAGFGPAPRGTAEPEPWAKPAGVARLAPENAADFGVDIRRDECRDGRMVAGEAEREVILKLLLRGEAAAQNVLPVGENSEEPVGRGAEFDQTRAFGSRKAI